MKLARSLVEALRTRITQARTGDAEATDDLAYAITRLREAEIPPPLPNGRAGVLMDLEQKAQRARETHDPAEIASLTDALLTFLDEELKEAIGGDGTPPKPAPPETPKPGDTADEDAALTERRTAAEADGYLRYAAADTSTTTDTIPPILEPAKEGNMAADKPNEDAPKPATPTMKCEACGHENALPGSAPTASSLMTEADRLAGQRLRTDNQTLRAENMELRAEKQRREMRERCQIKIREAGADGFVQIDDLVTFQEAQWPFLLGRIMGADRTYGGGEPAMPATPPPPPATRTAADVFTAALEG